MVEAAGGAVLRVLPFLPGVDDPHQHGRGVALADFNRDGKVDIVYGNWNGPHRLYLQMSAHGQVRFRVRRGLSLPLFCHQHCEWPCLVLGMQPGLCLPPG